jgi:uncharacterized membrane protein YdjX (TVP38/TMEM64 family)
MNTVNTGMARDGAGYLFALRLMPLFPFFLVNLLMGLTRIGVFRYWWVSQLAMLPATVVFLNAGRELGKVTSLRDICRRACYSPLHYWGYCRWSPAGCFPVISRLLKSEALCAVCVFARF